MKTELATDEEIQEDQEDILIEVRAPLVETIIISENTSTCELEK